jgi:hypothetical protein
MADEVERLLVKVEGDASGGVRALEETAAASEDMEKRVTKSTRKTGDEVDKTTAKTKKLGEESKKTSKSVASDFEKITGSSKTTAAAFDRNFSRSKTASEAYERTIRELNSQVKVLGDLYNKTGDDKFLKRMKEAQTDAKKLTKVAGDLGDALGKDVTKGAQSASGAMSDMIPIVASLIAIFAPLLGGAVAGAILGGVGLVGIGAGIAGQLHSPLVEGALAQFGADLKSNFTDATSAFAPELEATLGALDSNLGPFWDSMKKGFTELAPYLKVLGDGFARFMNEFGPGIEAAFRGAEPVLTIIATDLPQLGQALTVFFQQLEAGSTGAAEGIGYIFQAIETAIVATGYILHGLSDALDWVTNGIIRTLDILGHLPKALGGDKFKRAAGNMREFQTEAATAAGSLPPLQGNINLVNDATEKQHVLVMKLASDWSTATDAALAYDNAQLASIEAGQALSKSIKQNGRDWSETTTKGQANWHALLNDIAAKKAAYDADVKIHGVTKDNVSAYQKSIDKLLAQAAAAGLSKDQISLLRQQFEVLDGVLDKLNGRKVTFTIHGNVTGALPGGRASIASVLANSGVHQFANSGVSEGLGSIPHFDLTGTYAGRPGGIYRFAEASTKREALIAENGDSGRAMSTLRQAAAWHDAVVVSNDNSATTHNTSTVVHGGGGGSYELHATIVMDGKTVARALVPAVQRANSRSGVSTLG